MPLNWVDWIIILLTLYELYQGWKSGFVHIGISFIAFALSLWGAIIFNAPVAHFLSEKFGIASTWSSILSYVSIALVGQTILTQALGIMISKLPASIEKSVINEVFGAIVSAVNALTTVAFVMLIILALPMKGTVQTDIKSSVIGKNMLAFIDSYGGPIK